jgi:hypothetical protein
MIGIDPRPWTMRELATMEAPRREWLKFVCEILAAATGASVTPHSDVLPYNPAVMQGWASIGKQMPTG